MISDTANVCLLSPLFQFRVACSVETDPTPLFVSPQIVMSVSVGSPAAVTFVKTTQVAMSAAAEPATDYIQTAVAVMVRALWC